MNLKDYIEISKIINSELRQAESNPEARSCMAIANKLSDYFEKEGIQCNECNQQDTISFNRQQFLKDAGVK